ncbi:MAG TPA: type II secretion system protein GspG [Gammaproteobacteria bacterium]|jgi:general secretion pathway protein G|nr:type II secretion system major pseudopilin GspG [Gammaproteobacteria bacterium]MDP6732619.1 type II secretion system major pseudopilin GspG [Gammaproteobacteria bacterium]HAJ76869.1 type II secretion system protein GspG [Gammaproteobacteria bacterium]
MNRKVLANLKLESHSRFSQQGFTLIEILVVMAIIAMLAVMVAPNIFNQQAGAQRDAALSQISSLEAALDTYRLDVGEYPDSLAGLIENDSGRAAWNGPYLRRDVPMDPWQNDYVYESNGREFSLISYGPDGEQGGEGDDADIGLGL